MSKADASEVAIRTHGLSKEYGHRAILRQIDLAVFSGQAVGLMGANGAGKTTLLCCLASIVRPTEGEVRWFGHPATAAARQRKWIGMVAHESRLYPQLTLLENLVFSGRVYEIDQPRQRACKLLTEVGLAAHVDRLPAEVSRGMRQRAAVARALLHEPRVLLFDEPFSGLDTDGVQWLMATLRQQRDSGRAICFTTHDASKAAYLADKIWQLNGGKLSEHDPGRESETTDTWQAKRAA